MEITQITLGTTIEDRMGNTHTFYSALFKDKDTIRELLPKINSTMIITNILNVDDNGEFDDEAYEALLELVKLSLREPDENIEQWLDAQGAKIAIRTLLDLPLS